ncbi:ac57-like protein [Cryptophlebia peltastica nucleopolyhedrovirus]|uniref:Ac57-like protein n=1 Tax=Cryptophlebia peltastica nucleopolyhedrovirus TaxID=2304025 RepID=A0A346RNR2_9ABAC|nr:ac57-like protein [Cryptophlebia peltastica nucleopolyhedrovirus]AXS67709.1 ac57-like protein [Cryptophlebia peltastica nucleopolyhedrovirus]
MSTLTPLHINDEHCFDSLVRFAMATNMSARFLEFEEVCIDLRNVHFSFDQDHQSNNKTFIIFMNVKQAFYSNFKIKTDLSLETLTYYIYQHCLCTVEDTVLPIFRRFDQFIFNENDKCKSIIIQLHRRARVIVAECIRENEYYHSDVSGYIDFENRHTRLPLSLSEEERSKINREAQLKLLETT